MARPQESSRHKAKLLTDRIDAHSKIYEQILLLHRKDIRRSGRQDTKPEHSAPGRNGRLCAGSRCAVPGVVRQRAPAQRDRRRHRLCRRGSRGTAVGLSRGQANSVAAAAGGGGREDAGGGKGARRLSERGRRLTLGAGYAPPGAAAAAAAAASPPPAAASRVDALSLSPLLHPLPALPLLRRLRLPWWCPMLSAARIELARAAAGSGHSSSE